MTPYYDSDEITLFNGDCLDVLPLLSNISTVIADPPYTFGLASTQNGKLGSWADLMNNATWYSLWLGECFRLTESQQGAAWIFNSWRSFPVLGRAATLADWSIESLLVWDKEWIGPGGHRGLRPSYEMIALFAHDTFSLPNRGLPDIWRSKWSATKPNGHPAEKPLALCERIIKESGLDGVVLDPFAGSGTSLVAAKNLGHTAIGIEWEEKYCEVAAKRLSQGILKV